MLQIPARSTPVSPCMPCPRFGSYPLRRAGSRKAALRRRGAPAAGDRLPGGAWVRARPAALRRHGGDPGGGVARRGGAGARARLGGGLLPGARGGARAALRAAPAGLGLARFPHSLTAGLAPAPGRGFVTAPPARGTGRLLAVRRRLGGPVAVTTPSGCAPRSSPPPGRASPISPRTTCRGSVPPCPTGTARPSRRSPLAALASAGSSAGSCSPPGSSAPSWASGSGPCSSAWSCCASRPCGSMRRSARPKSRRGSRTTFCRSTRSSLPCAGRAASSGS